MCRTVLNVTGDLVAAVYISRTEARLQVSTPAAASTAIR
jgi:Na+/H+-dicarboxylate symporter